MKFLVCYEMGLYVGSEISDMGALMLVSASAEENSYSE